MAVGLGSMDMPVPSIDKWEWLNWKFPRPVHAGDTIYARWTLTQKRPPVGQVTTAIVVWRVDVHTADGALCAEGEVGASVTRHAIPAAEPAVQEATSAGSVPTSRRRRRRRPTPAGAGTKSGADGAAPVVEPMAEAPAKPATAERSSGGARRRRRRRPAGSSAARNGETPAPAAPVEAPPPPPVVSSTAAVEASSPLRRVIRRLRRP